MTKITYPDGYQLTYGYDALDRISQAGANQISRQLVLDLDIIVHLDEILGAEKFQYRMVNVHAVLAAKTDEPVLGEF